MSMTVDRIDHLVLNVTDVQETAQWYVAVLGMRRAVDDAGRTVLWFGAQKLHVRPFAADQQEWFTARVPSPGGSDLCFTTGATSAQIREHLEACGVPVEVGPVERAGSRGSMTSLYCRDPDGSLIEISTYNAAETQRPDVQPRSG